MTHPRPYTRAVQASAWPGRMCRGAVVRIRVASISCSGTYLRARRRTLSAARNSTGRSAMRSLKTLLLCQLGVAMAAALVLVTSAYIAKERITAEASRAMVAKDVTADVLPPTMYLIEMRLVLSQGIEGTLRPAQVREEFARLARESAVRAGARTARRAGCGGRGVHRRRAVAGGGTAGGGRPRHGLARAAAGARGVPSAPHRG